MGKKIYAGNGAGLLLNPRTNLKIGQRYIKMLLDLPEVDNNLVNLLIAYNAGPGNLRRWTKNLNNIEDPLLFIEMLPVAETRAYVERVLSNYWMYQRQMNKETNSLTSLAAGKKAYYKK